MTHQRIGGAQALLELIHFQKCGAAACAGQHLALAVNRQLNFAVMLQGLNQGRRLAIIKAKMALVDGFEGAVVAIVDEQSDRGVGRNIAFGLREGRNGDDVLRRARIAGQQNADFAHGGAIAGGSAGPGVVAGELPVFVRERKALRRSCQERCRTQPHDGNPKKRAHIKPCQHIDEEGIICAMNWLRYRNQVRAPPIRHWAKRKMSSARRRAVSTSVWLRLISSRLRQPSTISSICFATIAGSSTSSWLSSSCV